MKKCLSVLLAGALTAAMGMTAFALEIDGETDQLVIGQEEEEEIQLAGALLTPGESYTFPLSVTVDGVTMELTEELLDEEDWRIRLEENYGAEAVASCRVEEDGGDYSLQLTLKGGYPVEQTEAKYTLTLTTAAAAIPSPAPVSGLGRLSSWLPPSSPCSGEEGAEGC